MKLVECVPNISAGRDPAVYEAVASAAACVPGVRLLNIDPGFSPNRTVITFAGTPEAVLEGAWRLAQAAMARIDMRHQHGTHARLGALDVLPFVPLVDVSIEECVELARRLGERVGAELGVPVYLYEAAASAVHRQNLADVRRGEYEGLAQKLRHELWQPDFGPATFVPASGAAVIGARKLLVAYNVNLNTRDRALAQRIAGDLREKGRQRRHPDGSPILAADGQPLWDAGLLKRVKARGWFVPEFDCAQVSMNLVDLDVTALHVAYDACTARARAYQLQTTGSEIVGLVSKKVLLEAGQHYLALSGRSVDAGESVILATAIRSLGLGAVKPFNPDERIIEHRLDGMMGAVVSKGTLSVPSR